MFFEISQNLQEKTRARVTLLKKRLWRRCFPVNFAKFLRTPFSDRTPVVAASIFNNLTDWYSRKAKAFPTNGLSITEVFERFWNFNIAFKADVSLEIFVEHWRVSVSECFVFFTTAPTAKSYKPLLDTHK